MILIHGQSHTCTIFPTCPRKDDLHLSIIFSTGFKKNQCSPTVDVQILNRIADTIHMVHLSGKVKDIFLPFHQIIHGMGIPHITEIDMNGIRDFPHIKEVSS